MLNNNDASCIVNYLEYFHDVFKSTIMKFENSVNKLKDNLFKKIHKTNLVYNTCWEDPAIDRQLLEINPSSKIVMISSAGCNALDYMLDNPSTINCIDVNPIQNVLVNLKLSLFKHGDYKSLFFMFGRGSIENAYDYYAKKLRNSLPDYAKLYWDNHIDFFEKDKPKNAFYYKGTSGKFAGIFRQYINANPKLKANLNLLLKSETLDEQKKIYDKIESKILSKFVVWMMNRHITMSMLGVPRPQRQMLKDDYIDGIGGFLKENLRRIFTEIPIKNNYFWRLYIKGRYTKTCCPNYLLEKNYEFIKERASRFSTHNKSISDFLEENPNIYTQYVLLDHQDWLANHDLNELEREWKLILKNSAIGTKIIMRSAAPKINFIPKFVYEKVDFVYADELHKQDRVGTYGCTLLGTVKI